MKFNIVLAGCLFFFSLNAFGQGTIYFAGFGLQKSSQLCFVKEMGSVYIQIRSIYSKVKESSKSVSYDCKNKSPIKELNSVCDELKAEGLSEDIMISRIDVNFLEDNEIELLNNVKFCN